MADQAAYSLWLRPFGDIAFSLEQHIKKLSKKYDTPQFKPHVTLLGSVKKGRTELVQLTDTLARSTAPFEILLTTAAYNNTFYQSLYVKVDPGDELMAARRRAEKLFGLEAAEPYHPHLSLLYGDLDREEKERILNVMGREFHLRFSISSLLLIRTDGLPRDWEHIHTAEFGG
ncbi:MAG: 2'-5' RNA ligase family protein [Balneolaceae bacterium]|nr:2'-5' RNA ligase family protein [Balneolaceae bacterium]